MPGSSAARRAASFGPSKSSTVPATTISRRIVVVESALLETSDAGDAEMLARGLRDRGEGGGPRSVGGVHDMDLETRAHEAVEVRMSFRRAWGGASSARARVVHPSLARVAHGDCAVLTHARSRARARARGPRRLYATR